MRWFTCIALCMLSFITLAAEDRPWLGITLETSGGFDARVVIRSVKELSTASEMGLKKGDILSDISKGEQTWTIKGIDDLKSALNKMKVGDEIRVGIERETNALTLKGIVKARPSAGGIKGNQKMLSEKVQELAKLKSGSNTNAALALSMHQLGKTLDQLPEKIEEAAREFKEVYPDGEFVIKVEISISSNKLDDEATESDDSTDEDNATAENKESEDKDAQASETSTDKDAKEIAQPAQQPSQVENKDNSKQDPAPTPDSK